MELPSIAADDTASWHKRAVRRVIDTMHSRLADELSLDDMAEVAIMSPFHFNRTFRSITGIPPRHYLSALRLQAARRLLVTTHSSVTDVCFDVGYNSLGTFVRRFTDLLGLSPTRLRAAAAAPQAPLVRAYGSRRTPASGRSLRGWVHTPVDFAGVIFIALFQEAIPERPPRACTLVQGAGPYEIPEVPTGAFHLFAAGVRWASIERDLLLCDTVLRAGGHRVIVDDGTITGATTLTLREPSALDPPIVVSLTALLAERAHRSSPAPRRAAQAG